MDAALMAMKGPASRCDRSWRRRATSSFPEPDGPAIITRELDCAILSTAVRSWAMTGEEPTRSAPLTERARSEAFSRFRREVSIARLTTTSRRSAVKGFSMKS